MDRHGEGETGSGRLARRLRRASVAATALAMVAAPVLGQASATADSSALALKLGVTPQTLGTLPPSNPPANIPPSDGGDMLASTNAARAQEGVGPMSFDEGAFDALPVPEQIFVLENLERIGRGEPPIEAMTAQLDAVAQVGADANTDPPIPPLLTGGGRPLQGGSIWAGGTSSTLLANYLWMYDDGWGGSQAQTLNADCTSPSASGCWGHRDIILTQYSSGYCGGSAPVLVMGAATSQTYSGGSLAAIFLSTCGPTPSDEVSTWPQVAASVGITVESEPTGPSAAPTPPVGSNAPLVTAPGGGSANVRGIAATPDGKGYWLVGADGSVEAYGDATNYGSMAGQPLNAPIVGIAATPDGKGYWLVGADGGVFSFGDAKFYGSTGSLHLNAPVVGMAVTRDGGGYWFVAADGGVFAFGDAAFDGSMGSTHLNAPVVGMAADPATGGYWLVGADGGIFSFDAPFDGSTGSLHLNQPVVGMSVAPDGSGYWFVAADGGVFAFGTPFEGSMGGMPLAAAISGMASDGDGGYWLVGQDGGVFSFGQAPFYGSPA
jgi:hypothetical protein